jgi:uncharacterized membrane protein HdeD (DUF308 family)
MLDPTFLIIRGLLGIVIGVLAFAWPGLTIIALVGIFALYAFIDGAANLVMGLAGRRGKWWAVALEGLVGIAAGVVTFFWPGITALALIFFIASWAIVTGLLEIVAAIRLRHEISGEWLLMLSGLLSIAFGVLTFASPGAGAVGIAWILGFYAIASGIVLVSLGVRLRSRLVEV